MNLSGPLAAMAAYSRRLQSSTCLITREDPDAEPVYDPETMASTDPAPLTIYDGACLIIPTGGDRVVEFGEAPASLRQYDVVLTGLSDAIHAEDALTIADTADPQLDGTTMRVLDVKKSSTPTNRRLACEEVIA